MKKSILVSTLFGVFLVSAGIWNKPEASNKPVTVTEKSTLKDLAKDLADLNQVVIKTSSDDRQDSLKYFSYKIRKGDKLVRIARRFNTNIKDLMEVNKGNKNIRNENLLLAGGEISIPSVYSAKETIKLLVAQKEENEKLLRKVNELQKANQYLTVNHGHYKIALIFAIYLIAVMALMLMKKTDEPAERKEIENKLNAAIADSEANLENALKALSESKIGLKSQQNGILYFKVASVNCLHPGCQVKPEIQNALSHHYKPHEEKEDLKEIVDHA